MLAPDVPANVLPVIKVAFPAEPAKISEKGSAKPRKPRSGTGTFLPDLENLEWEPNSRGGWEAWHSPPGAVLRKQRTYLGYVGQKLLAEWEKLPSDERRRVVEGWIRGKRDGKGIS